MVEGQHKEKRHESRQQEDRPQKPVLAAWPPSPHCPVVAQAAAVTGKPGDCTIFTCTNSGESSQLGAEQQWEGGLTIQGRIHGLSPFPGSSSLWVRGGRKSPRTQHQKQRQLIWSREWRGWHRLRSQTPQKRRTGLLGKSLNGSACALSL